MSVVASETESTLLKRKSSERRVFGVQDSSDGSVCISPRVLVPARCVPPINPWVRAKTTICAGPVHVPAKCIPQVARTAGNASRFVRFRLRACRFRLLGRKPRSRAKVERL